MVSTGEARDISMGGHGSVGEHFIGGPGVYVSNGRDIIFRMGVCMSGENAAPKLAGSPGSVSRGPPGLKLTRGGSNARYLGKYRLLFPVPFPCLSRCST